MKFFHKKYNIIHTQKWSMLEDVAAASVSTSMSASASLSRGVSTRRRRPGAFAPGALPSARCCATKSKKYIIIQSIGHEHKLFKSTDLMTCVNKLIIKKNRGNLLKWIFLINIYYGKLCQMKN